MLAWFSRICGGFVRVSIKVRPQAMKVGWWWQNEPEWRAEV